MRDLLQATLMPIVGSVYYIVCTRRRGYLGRYRFAYRRAPGKGPNGGAHWHGEDRH